jgi:branched-subunit amino acid ABC-type transport system permease component
VLGQSVVNGIVSGLLLALPAIALTLTFGLLKFSNFAIGAMLTFGAYAGWVANVLLGLPLLAAMVMAALVSAIAAVLVDILVFSRLRDRGSVVLLVASIGVSLVLENICRFAFGNATRSFDTPVARPLRWHGLHISHEQILTAVLVIGCLVVFQVLLHATPLGRAMRAVADDPSLAAVRGIEAVRIGRITWALSGALAALAGVLGGLDRAVEPLLGWSYQIPVFAATILGGLGNPGGAVLGALVIGVTEELSGLIMPTSYRQVVSFCMIVLLLLFRSQGLLGARAVRK